MSPFEILISLLTVLVLTVGIESAVFLLFFRRPRFLWLCILVNAATNPALNLILLFLRSVGCSSFLWLVLLEILVTLAEGFLYRLTPELKHPFLFSLLANSVSFLTGLLIF